MSGGGIGCRTELRKKGPSSFGGKMPRLASFFYSLALFSPELDLCRSAGSGNGGKHFDFEQLSRCLCGGRGLASGPSLSKRSLGRGDKYIHSPISLCVLGLVSLRSRPRGLATMQGIFNGDPGRFSPFFDFWAPFSLSVGGGC